MSVYSQTFQSHSFPFAFGRRVSAPRGAKLAAELFIRATRWLSRPQPATASREQEAAALREMATRVQATDPGFAADLFAAASRHEWEEARN
jgi:hypothetical protein